MSLELAVSGSAVVGADGTAVVTLSPSMPGEVWHITNVSVYNDGALQCKANSYRDYVSPNNFRGRTSLGNSDQSTEDWTIRVGRSVATQWVDASVGSNCTIILDGIRTIPGVSYGD